MTAPTVSSLLARLREVDDRRVMCGDGAVTWRAHVQNCVDRAAVLASLLDPARPEHFGVLLDNSPEFSALLGGAALSGSVLVGLNSTRRGPALARDVTLADCQFVLTEARYAALLDGDVPVLDVGSERWRELLSAHSGAGFEPVVARPDDLLMLLFTSGTSGDPKAVRCTHQKVAFPGVMLSDRFGLSGADTVYLSMPMFHSNAIMAGWSVALAAGANLAIRPRFSASGFLSDIRRFGATYANYVGKPLAYVLATPEQPDDADNSLRVMYGNEGSAQVVERFAKRFGTIVLDAFGSSEGGISISPDPAAPRGALGRLPDGVEVLDPLGAPCPPGTVGELVNVAGAGAFAGYYNCPDADAERMRDGRYHSGDLAYLDDNGFVFFAGRTSGWLRVDGENLATAPIERILLRCPAIERAAVYGVPDPDSGDRVMAAVVSDAFEPEALTTFLGDQPDLGPKQWPRYVRLCADLPQTATFKVLTRVLHAEGLECADPVWELVGAGYELC